MAGFAPSYYHESNNAWLNNLVSDIIDPGSRAQSRTHNRDQAGDLINNPGPDTEHQSTRSRSLSLQWRHTPTPNSYSRTSVTPQRATRSDSFNRCSHYSYRSTISQASESSPADSSQRSMLVRDMSFVPISKDGGFPLLDRYHEQTHQFSPDVDGESPTTSRDTPTSQLHLLPSSQHLEAFTPLPDFPHELTSTLAAKIPSRTQQPSKWLDDARVADVNAEELSSRATTRLRTSLGRTYSEKRLSDLQKPPLARVVTDVTENFTEFAPHPAVRVFSGREGLGEAAGPEEDDDHEYPKPFALALIVIGICLSVFIISVDRNIVTTAIPQITETFQSYNDVGWYGSAYFLTASAFQPLYGRVYMSFDTRWAFLAALAIFELGSLLGAVSPNSDVLILGRAVQGFGSAGILTGSFVVATHSVPLRGRPILFAFVGILYGVGALAGPLLGGVFTDLLTWRWAFWINLPVGAITFVGVFFFFKPRRNNSQNKRPSWVRRILALDLIGNAMLLGACVMLFLALQLSETSGSWNNAPVVGLLCGFGVTLVIFVGWLFYRGDKALIPPRIIRQRTVAASCGVAFFLYGGLLIHAYYLPIWFQAVKGDSAIQSGINMIPYMLANAVFSMIGGIFTSKNGLFAPPTILGCAIGTVGCGLLTTIDVNTSTGKWIGYEILISAGLGLAIQQGFSAVQTALPLEEVPIGTAAVVASQSLGGAIFVSVGNTILQDHLLNQNADNAIPGVDVRAVFQMGATMFRSFVPVESLPALLKLYNHSLQTVFIAAIPLVGISFLCALSMEWRSVRTKQELAKKRQEAEKA